eukprot:1193633-Prorocentrum_minimum.AAC.6
MASFVITTSARVACIARNAGPTAPQKPMRRAVAMSARCADAYRKTRLTQMCGDYRRAGEGANPALLEGHAEPSHGKMPGGSCRGVSPTLHHLQSTSTLARNPNISRTSMGWCEFSQGEKETAQPPAAATPEEPEAPGLQNMPFDCFSLNSSDALRFCKSSRVHQRLAVQRVLNPDKPCARLALAGLKKGQGTAIATGAVAIILGVSFTNPLPPRPLCQRVLS